jgi:mannan polymerase II complex ANP1 subunit
VPNPGVFYYCFFTDIDSYETYPKHQSFKPRSGWAAKLDQKWSRISPRRRKTYKQFAGGLIAILVVFKMLFSSGSIGLSTHDTDPRIEYYDLKEYDGHVDGKDRDDMVLMCIPLRNAAPVIPMMFSHLRNLTYPHRLVDLAFLVSDSDDSTTKDLQFHISRLLEDGNMDEDISFHGISIYEKDFGAIIGQGFDDRHGVRVQGVRRKLMGRARNWLLTAALKPYHSWVYWRDADIETSPPTIIEDLMKHGRDVIVPNVWRPLPEWLGGEQPYDLNSWQESEAALELAKTLDEDEVIVEGYAEYPTWRPHLAYFRSEDGDPDVLIDLDGIGGVSILARARVFRQGANFPGFAFENHAETEGFGKMSRKMGFTVSGLVHYTVWHLYEPSVDDIRQMKEMEEAKLAAVVDSSNES